MSTQPIDLPAGTVPASGVLGRLRAAAADQRPLALAGAAAAIALLLQGLLTFAFALRARSEFVTITRDSVPSIIAAQDLRAQVQDMDGDLANAVLQNGGRGPNGEDWIALRSTSAKKVLNDIATAQSNITFPGECEAISALRAQFVDYSTFAAQTEALAAAAGGGPGQSPVPVVDEYLKAIGPATAMDTAVGAGSQGEPATPNGAAAPSADAATPSGACSAAVSNSGGLYTVNANHEAAAYSSGRSMIRTAIGLSAVIGVLAIVALAISSLQLSRGTHRYLNLGLIGGAAAAVILLIYSLLQLTVLYNQYKTVSKDSLDSIKAALEIKAIANNANADESRWLLFAANDSAHQTNRQSLQDDFAHKTAQVDGLINSARANVTFDGEKQAIDGTGNRPVSGTMATDCNKGMQPEWNQYKSIDGQIRGAQNGSNHAQAVTLDLGTSNQAFNDFTNCVNRLQQVNYDHYQNSGSSAKSSALLLAIAGAVIAIAGLVTIGLGFLPRFGEL